MSSLIKFTPLSGAKNEQPLCYLLEIDEACILLDCGWDETFDLRLVQQLRKIAPRIDAILLTHCDVSHLGALPFIMAQQGVKAKVYATLPVVKMGQLTVYDAVLSRSNREDFDVFNLDDIDAAWEFDEKKQGFRHFVPLRYQQSAQLEGRAEGISICPLNAGHTVGGAVWKITKDSESIVYAVDYNHAQETPDAPFSQPPTHTREARFGASKLPCCARVGDA
jgi:cleavage and polyadenylation specificity factor subunit 2